MDKAKYKQYVELIRSRLSDYRFYHSVCVAEAAVQLAERFGADVEQAYVAGILHDVMKEEEPSVQRAYIKKPANGCQILKFALERCIIK